jgi:hypothetical protein
MGVLGQAVRATGGSSGRAGFTYDQCSGSAMAGAPNLATAAPGMGAP